MVSYLAFDSRTVKCLLDNEDNYKYFDKKYPVFYKNEDQTTAIDVSLEMNQIRSVNLMIKYIITFQDSYVYSHLFERNLVVLINKGVEMTSLFESNIFSYNFDFDEWPATNVDTTKLLAPYNKSIFKLRYEYPSIFRKQFLVDEKILGLELAGKLDQSQNKVFKIKYRANLLTMVKEESGNIINAIANSDELSIFQTDLVKDMLDYKW